ncbi:phage major capsid protein [Streptosporangium sp. DT93]|uniref:phage major capsid protein n=1 Tax=Streptosporangium sp. DT93 TaxID=3393428 RepID=UPI003CED36E3
MDINAMRQERARLAAAARGIMDGAQRLARGLTSEEETEFDRLMADADTLERTIEREERLRERERIIADLNPPTNPDDPGPGTRTAHELQTEAWRSYLLNGRSNLSTEHARALNMGSDPEGGYLVAPQQWVRQLLQTLDDQVVIRRLATVMQLTEGESLGVPTLETDLLDAEWTSEVGTGSDDEAMRFGGRELRPHPLAKRVKISRTLLRRAAMDPENIVRDRLAYKFGVTEEKSFLTGDGNQKPLGLFTASSQGISTNRDVVVGDISSDAWDINAEGLIDAKYTLKAGYHARARWLFHRFSIARIRKLRTDAGAGPGTGDFIWQPGLTSDRPDTILEVPYEISEFVPSTFADGAYVGMIGDFSYYWIVEALRLDVQRLVELYAEKNQVGFIARAEVDGMPIFEEPFVRLKVQA